VVIERSPSSRPGANSSCRSPWSTRAIPFRGEYVRLGYGIDTLPMRLLTGERRADNAAVFGVLERDDGGRRHPVQVQRAKPAPCRAHRAQGARSSVGRTPLRRRPPSARYGIEQHFVPQGERLESLARAKKLAARIAVDSGGNAGPKGLVIDGKLEYQEPLF
jgi:uncharacterized membrane-anchored protein